jgi:tetratricopeptide (TPR) repeat protein
VTLVNKDNQGNGDIAMNTRTMFVKLGRLLTIFTLTLAAQLLPIKRGLSAEEPPSHNYPSTLNASVGLEKKIYQLVKDLEYSDQVAQDFVRMVRPWNCEKVYQKICQAEDDVKQKKISWNQYAQVEEDVINQLARTIIKEITGVNTSVASNSKYFDLVLVVKEKKAQCLGYTQLFYILGNSMGLTIQAINVVDHSQGPMPAGTRHAACAVGLHNGKAMQVDLTFNDGASKSYIFTEEYGKVGNYWELKDKKSRLNIHKRIQLLDKNGLVAIICYNRGTIYSKSGKLTEAISDFNKAIELNPKDAVAYNNRGNAYGKSGKLTEAILDFNKAIELNPKYDEAHNNRGNAYSDSGKLTEAISDYNKAIELNPKDAEAYGNRGLANAKLGKKEDAKTDLRKAMQLNPSLKEALKKMSSEFKLDL